MSKQKLNIVPISMLRSVKFYDIIDALKIAGLEHKARWQLIKRLDKKTINAGAYKVL